MRALFFVGGAMIVLAAVPTDFFNRKKPNVSAVASQADAAMILSFSALRSLEKPQPKPPAPPPPQPDGEAGLSG